MLATWGTPGLRAPSFIERIRDAGLPTRTLIVADSEAVGVIDIAFRAGATDFATKPLGLELVSRLKHAIASAPRSRVCRVGRLSVDLEDRSAMLIGADGAQEQLLLTRVESQLLIALAERTGENVPVAHLLDTVWGSSAAVQPHAVEAAIWRLRKKLGRSRALVVRGARGTYRLGPSIERRTISG